MDARVLVVGLGGLGVPVVAALVEAGVRRLVLADPDEVELSNLHRQVLYATGDIGRPKVEVTAQALRQFRSDLELELIQERLDLDRITALLADDAAGADLVLEGSDSFDAKFAVNAASVAAGRPAVIGGILALQGVVLSVRPGASACYACVFEAPPPPGLVPTCREAGVLGALAGVVGAIMAEQAMRLLVSGSHAAEGREEAGLLVRFDGAVGRLRQSRPRRRPGCPVCTDARGA